jgi:hypothetical protein
VVYFDEIKKYIFREGGGSFCVPQAGLELSILLPELLTAETAAVHHYTQVSEVLHLVSLVHFLPTFFFL